MKIYKTLSILFISLFLNGCVETAALVGPAFTVASTGNVYQAGLTYGTSQIIEKETGKSSVEYVSNILESNEIKEEKKIQEEFVILVKQRIKNTRKNMETSLENMDFRNLRI